MVVANESNDAGLARHGLGPFWSYIWRIASRIEAG